MANRLNYSDEDVDEEREMEASPGLQSQTFRETEGQRTQGIPLLLAAHLRETETRRRTLSPRETLFAHGSPTNGAPHAVNDAPTLKRTGIGFAVVDATVAAWYWSTDNATEAYIKIVEMVSFLSTYCILFGMIYVPLGLTIVGFGLGLVDLNFGGTVAP
nr:hypothetical protein [Tanacetum cinerariifolium]